MPNKSAKVCLTCPLEKFTKLPYCLSESHSLSAFDLVHIDIWGPYKVCTKGKFKFFLTIVDDKTRHTWVYLLQYKSEALKTLENFMSYVHTHFNTTVKTLRSDNALEFDDAHCKQFFAKNGVVHQSSCVYRPQQNARVERKHRHILEVARSLRFQASLPLNYWGDCVLAAVYLINRTPSYVLNFKIPYEILYDSKPDYKPIRTFGCLAFAYNPDTHADKFSMRGVPCVFLGYPPNKKGYKLLNLITKKSFGSRDVRFEESIFPFSSNSETPYMNPVPNIIPKTIPDDFDYLTDKPTISIPNSPDDNEPAEVETVEPIPPPLRRSSRIHTAPKWHVDYHSNQTSYISNLAYTQVAPDFQ